MRSRTRGHVLYVALEDMRVSVRGGVKPNYKCTLMLPSAHPGRRIGLLAVVSHKEVVMLWCCFGDEIKQTGQLRTVQA